ncbi:uncharacterized protein GBIM_18987 [Gryllus bimaculatus]|nr:uncharacterized protein GBIM_18987 [Gryllus bimaculatus]
MQCGELVYRKVTIMTQGSDSVDNRQKKPEKESIHSGHFMVSHFEAEAEDDECDVAVPIPNEDAKFVAEPSSFNHVEKSTQQVSIETSLTKLFQCMSLAYRQKLTSPRWNRFKGIRLRWKDKIRLNNVIWRCWHMQFIMKQNTMVCQFASPLDVDTHNKPELQTDMDMFDWQPHSNDSNSMNSMMVDEDYMEFMSDTLFSTIQSNQPFAFPDPREIARGAGLADFIQPSLVQLQPNLDDFMDTLEPLQDLVSLSHIMKLPSVPEECVVDDLYRSTRSNAVTFPEVLDNQNTSLQVQLSQHQQQKQQQQQHHQQLQQQIQQQIQPQQLTTQLPQQQQQTQQNLQYTATIFAQPEVSSSFPPATNLITRPQDFAQVLATFEEYFYLKVLEPRYLKLKNLTLFVVPGYKYPTSSPPTLPAAAGDPPLNASVSPPRRQNVRSNSLTSEDDFFAVPKFNKNKLHIRKTVSGSSLATPTTQRQHPPPLVSTNSDPNLPTVSSSTLQPLLAQLLSTNANNGVFNFTGASDRFKSSQVVPILPMPTQGMNNTASSGASQASLPQSTTALLITTPVTMTSVAPLSSSGTTQPPSGSHVLLNTFPASRKPTYSPDSSSSSMGVGLCSLVPSLNVPPMAPPKPLCVRPDSASQRIRRPDSTPPKQEHRRECHTKAEHKRRCNIKNGFDMLHSLIPQLHQNPNAKLSKAAMLQKGADYIQQLRAERDQLRDEMQNLKHEIECLNQSISNCQSMLPATGAPVSRQRASKMREMFDEYVPVLNSLRYLSTATEILTDPSKLPEEARRAVLKQDHQH